MNIVHLVLYVAASLLALRTLVALMAQHRQHYRSTYFAEKRRQRTSKTVSGSTRSSQPAM